MASARRGKGCPPSAHAVAVAASRRLHCAARSGVAPPNSLRSLRSLRSNKRGESVLDARWRAPTPALRCSSPPKSRPAGSPCREVHGAWCSLQTPPRWLQRRVWAGCDAPVRRRGAQGSWPRAQRASTTDSSRLFERRERSERSELSDGPRDRAPQGSRSAAETASAKRRGLPARAFARADRRMQSRRSRRTAAGRYRRIASSAEVGLPASFSEPRLIHRATGGVARLDHLQPRCDARQLVVEEVGAGGELAVQ